jgi:RND family efflux transporter MFP subunit
MTTLRRLPLQSRFWMLLALIGGGAAFVHTVYGSPNGEAGGTTLTSKPTAVLEVTGKTQCVLTRKCIIAPVPLHPVVAVLVEPGARVKKDQALVKLDDDEPQADVRAKQAALENAQAVSKEAHRFLAQCESSHERGVIPEQRYHDARLAALKAEADERTAKAMLDSAKAELEHYEVQALMDGVVNWLEVHPGTVSRPGTTVWGEILDIKVLDVRCELPPDQADRVKVGATADVVKVKGGDVYGQAKVLFVGIEADKKTGLMPVLLRIENPEEKLKCGVAVTVRFPDLAADAGK